MGITSNKGLQLHIHLSIVCNKMARHSAFLGLGLIILCVWTGTTLGGKWGVSDCNGGTGGTTLGDLTSKKEKKWGNRRTIRECMEICTGPKKYSGKLVAQGMTLGYNANSKGKDKCFCEYGVTGVNTSDGTKKAWRTCLFKGTY